MGLSNFPFPSFTLVLTTDRVTIPGRSIAIRFATPATNNQPTPSTDDLMATIDSRDEVVNERQFSFNVGNESETFVVHCHIPDADSVWEEMRPSTSRGVEPQGDGDANNSTKRLPLFLKKLQSLFPFKAPEAFLRKALA